MPAIDKPPSRGLAPLVLAVRGEGAPRMVRVAAGGGPIVVGRADGVALRIDDPAVSSRHAEISIVEGRPVVRDLASLNGTFLNGVRIVQGAIAPGDEIRVGGTCIAVEAEAAPPAPPQAKRPIVEEIGEMSTARLDLASLGPESFEQLRHVDEGLALVWKAGERLNGLASREEIFAAVVDLASRAFEPARVFVLEPAPGNGGFACRAGSVDAARPPSFSIAQAATSSGCAILSTEMGRDERFRRAKSVAGAKIRTAMAAPLITRRGAAPVIYVDRVEGALLRQADLRLLGLIANHVASAVTSADLMDELRRRNEELSGLNADLETKVLERTAELSARMKEVARLAAEKDELVAVAAHDIRNPLTSIIGFLELARMDLGSGDPEALERDLAVIEGTARDLTRLLGDLLDVKRIEAGNLQVVPVRVEARPFLEEATALGALQAQKRGVAFELDVEPGLEIRIDARRFAQAVANLVANALKFTKPGGRVAVRARSTGDGPELVVSDTGCGMSPAEVERLFNPYVQGEAGRKRGGTGLGLVIARKVVDLHGGSISVRSVEGRGTEFSIRLPDRCDSTRN